MKLVKRLHSYRRYKEAFNDIRYLLERAESFIDQRMIEQARTQYAMAYRVANIFISENPEQQKRGSKLLAMIAYHQGADLK